MNRLIALFLVLSGPLYAGADEQEDVLTCISGVGASTTWNQCLGQIFAPCEGMEVGSDPQIACLQEQEVFQSLAEDLNIEMPGFFDLRDRAGWSDQGADATPIEAEGLKKKSAAKMVLATNTKHCSYNNLLRLNYLTR